MAGDRRRQHGSGSIYRREADGKWVGRIEAGYTKGGGRRRLTVIGDSEAEVRRRLRDKQRELAANRERAQVSDRITVKGWADRWLPVHATLVRPNTYATDAGAVGKWIVPTIGHIRLSELTAEDVRSVRNAIVRAGRSTTTARQAHYTLRGMLKAAAEQGAYVAPGVLLARAPLKAVSDRAAVPGEEGARLLVLALQRPDAARWVMSLLHGMRQGEVLGMTWPALDGVRGTLDVRWQLQSLPYVDRTDPSQGFRKPDGYDARQLVNAWHLTPPKTRSGFRVIPILPFVGDLLDGWRAVAPANPWGLVFSTVNAAGSPVPIDPKLDRKIWAELQEEAGVRHPSDRPYVGHEMRHATATYLLEQGVDPRVVTSIMGHSSVVTSQGYQHVSTALARDALSAVAGRLGLPSAVA